MEWLGIDCKINKSMPWLFNGYVNERFFFKDIKF